MTRKYRITGRVQGVFFRDSTRQVATRLGMTGHAINLADGSVEVLATGTDDAHRELERWLQNGPPSARVDSVDAEPATASATPGFGVG